MAAFAVKQTAALVNGQPYDLRKIRPAQIPELRQLEAQSALRCPACGGELRVVIEDEGPVAEHHGVSIEHEPEDPITRISKEIIRRKMAELFPRAAIELDVKLDKPARLADLVAVRDNGGRLIVEHQAADMKKGQMAELVAGYREEGLRALWLLDPRRLKVGKVKNQVATVNIGKLEVDLLREGEPLLYLEPHGRRVMRLLIPAQARELLKHDKVTSLGRLPCLMRHYKLDQLRVKAGQWQMVTDYDPPLPAPPALPKRLQKKLETLEKANR